MTRTKWIVGLAATLALVGICSRQGLQAQPPKTPEQTGEIRLTLDRIHDFPFARPISLAQLRDHLSQTLHLPVVLDKAGLERAGAQEDDTVELELKGVRLRTGLKLLLDQLGLGFKAVPEDNLLIITDAESADDPLQRIWSELRSLHRDLHDLQDSVEELLESQDLVDDGRTPVRKPTIIEEQPNQTPLRGLEKPGTARPAPSAPAEKQPTKPSPPQRIPLSHDGMSVRSIRGL